MNNNMFYRGPSSFRPPMGPGPVKPFGPPPKSSNDVGGFIVPFVLGGLTYSIFNNRPYPYPYYVYPPYYRPYPYYY